MKLRRFPAIACLLVASACGPDSLGGGGGRSAEPARTVSSAVGGTTWYVRDGGGTPTQCTGTTNAAYAGSGSGQACAVNDLAWVVGTPGANGLMAGGDTVMIVGDSDVHPGQQAQYLVGYGMANTASAQCSTSSAYACSLSPLPAGSAGSPTQVIGMGTHKPQLWGTQGIYAVLSATNGDTTLENLEITDHSPCSYLGADPSGTVDGVPAVCASTDGSYPYGDFAKYGLQLEGTNIVTQNLFVHRFGAGNVFFTGNVSNWSSSNDVFVGSGGGGSLTNGGTMTFGGNNTMNGDVWAFGGCSEHYPDVSDDPLDSANYHHCADQTAGGYNLGGGFMMQNDGSGPCGNWTISDSQFRYNIKTNVDFLHCDGTGTFTMIRSRSEGSSGEALKLNVAQVTLEADQLIANAPDWTVPPLSGLWSPTDTSGNAIAPAGWMICRGRASTIFVMHPGQQIDFTSDDVVGNCSALVELSTPADSCTGSAVNARNTKFIGGYAYDVTGQQVDLFYNGGSDGNGGGDCGGCTAVPFDYANSSVYGASDFCNVGCGGTYPGTSTVCSDPLIVGEQTASLTSLLGPTAYYAGTTLGDELYLQSTSPLRGAGAADAGVTRDYNGYPFANPPSIGALEYGSVPAQASPDGGSPADAGPGGDAAGGGGGVADAAATHPDAASNDTGGSSSSGSGGGCGCRTAGEPPSSAGGASAALALLASVLLLRRRRT